MSVLGLFIQYLGVLVSLFAGNAGLHYAPARESPPMSCCLATAEYDGTVPRKRPRRAHAHRHRSGRGLTGGVRQCWPRGASDGRYGSLWVCLRSAGFIVTYALVCMALPRYLRDRWRSPPGSADHSLDGRRCHGVRSSRKSHPVPEDPTASCPTSSSLTWWRDYSGLRCGETARISRQTRSVILKSFVAAFSGATGVASAQKYRHKNN